MKAQNGRALIRAKLATGGHGYVMVAIDHNGNWEYPQEDKKHTTARSIYNDARQMYRQAIWDWNETDHSIKTEVN